jgi:hypothetical protein
MAKPLDKIINIDGTDYSVTVHNLTIKTAAGDNVVFDGSEPKTIEIPSVDDFITEIPSEYITESELKTINGESIIGHGDIIISGGNGTGELAEYANKIRVSMGDVAKVYAAITISKDEPTGGTVGDIWFKY